MEIEAKFRVDDEQTFPQLLALERKSILITQAPEDYITIGSGLGESAPVNIVVLPVLFEDQVMAVIEMASFTTYSDAHLTLLEQLSETLGVVLNTIVATMRTRLMGIPSVRATSARPSVIRPRVE